MADFDMADPDYWNKLAQAQARGSSGSEEGHGLFVTFYKRPVQNKFKSRQEGRVVFEERDFVQIRAAGQPCSVTDREVQDSDKTRFPATWAAFQARQSGVINGTPLEGCAFLSPVQVMEMKANGIMNVEMLANLDDAGIPKLGLGGRDLVKRAQQFLAGPGDTEKSLRQENVELKRRLAAMEARLDAFMRKYGNGADAEADDDEVEPVMVPARRGRRPRAAA